MKDLTILLVGAPNCGKSTLFYKLTHKRADIGNRAGVTVKESAGRISKKLFPSSNDKGTRRWASDVTLVDLPGIYSLTPHTEDEAITVDRLTKTRFDMIINVLDSTALEAHLPLTLSLLKAFPKTPIIVAANMADELSDEGLSLDEGELSRSLDAPVIAVSAAKKKGLSQLCQKIAALSEKKTRTRRRVSAKSGDIAKKATKRSTSGAPPRAETTSDRIDKLITSKPFGIPLFFLIFAAVFYISFGGIGARLTETFRESVILPLQSILESVIALWGAEGG